MNSMSTYVVRETLRAVEESIRSFKAEETKAADVGDCSTRAINAACVAGLECAKNLLVLYATADVTPDKTKLAPREDGGINE